MPAQKCRLFNNTAFTWDNDEPFNGYLLLIMSFPSANSGTPWTYAVLNDSHQRLRVPVATKIPIRNGFLESDAAVWQAQSLTPPRCQYSSFYYDNTDRLIAIEGNFFSANDTEDEMIANPFPITDFPGAFPFPQTVPGTVPTVETPTGLINGSNTNFTLTRAGNEVLVYLNDDLLAGGGVDYTLSGASLIMDTAPATGDVLKVFIF